MLFYIKFRSKTMPNVIVYRMFCVGMHHWGTRELEVGTPYFCKPEPQNAYNRHAVAVFVDKEMQRQATYSRPEDACTISRVCTMPLDIYILKLKTGQQNLVQKGHSKFVMSDLKFPMKMLKLFAANFQTAISRYFR